MHAPATSQSNAEGAVGIAAALAGLGVVTFALFPLALPFVILLIASTAPLLVVALAAALVGGALTAVGLAVRAVARRAGRRRREPSPQAGVSMSPAVRRQVH
ncbi:MAG: hypothetical protein GEU88_03555 [Solirubrobacterales bacterium]|nr:hypothetical protein [Solirubrobacterales bacterium]